MALLDSKRRHEHLGTKNIHRILKVVLRKKTNLAKLKNNDLSESDEIYNQRNRDEHLTDGDQSFKMESEETTPAKQYKS